MCELKRLKREIVARMSHDDRVALLLSAGIDSISTGIVCQELGKEVHAYTYEIQRYRSQEREKVEAIARHFGWRLSIITVPTVDVAADFKRLAIQHQCKTKVQFEVLFPLLYVIPAIHEREIWTGFNADDHYGNTRRSLLDHAHWTRNGVSAAERKRRFDQDRQEVYGEFDKPDSGDTWWFARNLALQHGKELLDVYVDPTLREYFSRFDHDQLSPLGKPIIRAAFAEQLKGLPDSCIAKGKRLQKGGRVDELFRALLVDPDINRFEIKYSTISTLCQRWSKEVDSSPEPLTQELASLPPRRTADVRVSARIDYQPYVMADVMAASEARRFSVISTFAGGGGSSIGYRLAGGRVLLANEFVREAARTYRINFSDCMVDQCDIRDISASRESVCRFLASVGLSIGEIDVLDGSPPCCEFSTAGRGIGDQDIPRSYSDVKQNNIASLPFDLVDLVILAQPKVFICENVPAFATRGKDVFHRVLRALRFPVLERAYYANWAILSASDFGVPQKRQRLFIIGIRKDVAEAIEVTSDERVADVFPAPTKVGVSVRSAFEDLRQPAEDVWPWRRSAMVTRLGGLMRLLPKNPPKPTRLGHVFPGYKKHYTLTRCSWSAPAPTMVVSGQRPDGLTGAIHPEEDRKFTLPELKRLTALPDDFVLTGTLGQAAERVCRMVPPLLTKAIAESVYQKVLLPHAEKVK
ncbi:DNA-cytosine methyltransferase [Bradyrhizobium elkanii]|uniref:DNA (cytosine-5-)-methyltransferase n=1 Tax=Bradyrhizobium elkanii TaxID=29448 RepID=UPI00216A8872|nr:DNA (cytosine-5-)-methyltransferase [Bradyrhizobium elkanii]MCS3687486.1 DNA-cytosine methyltransferase [Bradyrhizobium elkanii]